jgi:hypothetical protein
MPSIRNKMLMTQKKLIRTLRSRRSSRKRSAGINRASLSSGVDSLPGKICTGVFRFAKQLSSYNTWQSAESLQDCSSILEAWEAQKQKRLESQRVAREKREKKKEERKAKLAKEKQEAAEKAASEKEATAKKSDEDNQVTAKEK